MRKEPVPFELLMPQATLSQQTDILMLFRRTFAHLRKEHIGYITGSAEDAQAKYDPSPLLSLLFLPLPRHSTPFLSYPFRFLYLILSISFNALNAEITEQFNNLDAERQKVRERGERGEGGESEGREGREVRGGRRGGEERGGEESG